MPLTNVQKKQRQHSQMKRDDDRTTMTIAETARYLGKSRGTVYTLINSGSLPTIQIGKRRLVKKSQIDKMMQDGGIPICR